MLRTTLDFLQTVTLFSHLAKDELEKLSATFERHTITKNTLIFAENLPANYLYVIVNGQAKVFKVSHEGKEYILGIMTTGDILGAVPMFTGEKYPANCVAMTDVTMLAIARVKFLNLIQHNPQIALNMLALQAQQLRKFSLKIEQLSLKNTQQKLADYLLKNLCVESCAKQYIEHNNEIGKVDSRSKESKKNKAQDRTGGKIENKGENKAKNKAENNTENTLIVDNAMSMQDLANYLGVTRENLSRTFNNFIKNGVIAKSTTHIVIKKIVILKKIAANSFAMQP